MKDVLMPILFIGHGSPMNAMEVNEFTDNFKRVAKVIGKPKAIVCISAHWVSNMTKVTAMKNPKTIHDFYGFPRALYEIQYLASGDEKLAKKIKSLLEPIKVELDMEWGLDHGTWSVLKHMYPEADVPVVQICLDYNKDALYHFNLAKKLASLRSEGILIIGSGNIVHNLGEVDFDNIDTYDFGFAWAKRVQVSINKNIMKGDFKPLLNYKEEGKDFDLAIPTPEHFLPLIYILGLKEKNEKIEMFNDVLVGGSISMTSLKIS